MVPLQRRPAIATLAAALLLPCSVHVAAEDGLRALTGPDSPLRKGDTVAFFGDSVTLQGDGEKGYIGLLRTAIANAEKTKDLGVRLIGHGLNGGRVPTVLEGKSPWGDIGGKMEDLLKKESPTVVVVFLGINDVWHGEKGTSAKDFEAGLRTMLELVSKVGAIPVLCTPPGIGEEPHGKNPIDKQFDEYCGIIRTLAKEKKVALCDVRAAFGERLKKESDKVGSGEEKDHGILTYDGVHMIDAGNELIAGEMARTIAAALAARSPGR